MTYNRNQQIVDYIYKFIYYIYIIYNCFVIKSKLLHFLTFVNNINNYI